MTLQPIQISIGGSYALDQTSLATMLSKIPGLQVVPLEKLSSTDVLIWDASNTRSAELPVTQPGTAVLLLLEEPDFQSLPKNFSGLFSKEESPTALAAAIRQVARGEQYISPSLVLAYLESQQVEGREMRDSGFEALSEREQEILDLLKQGQSNKSIAAHLYLSVRTVEGHLAKIYSKLGVHSRAEAMLAALESR